MSCTEASAEMRKLTVERRMGLMVCDTSNSVLGERTVSGTQSSEAGLVSVSKAGVSQKKRKAVVRKESADTQEFELSQWNETWTWTTTWKS